MNLNKNVFREYDVRGIADSDFSDRFPYNLGKAFGSYIVKNNCGTTLAISGDVRPSTERLKKEFIDGVLSTGLNVVDIGVVPTPVNYFINYQKHEVDGSVQITGSHNPSEYNGFKFTLQKESFFGDKIKELYNIIKTKDYHRKSNGVDSKGRLSYLDIIPEYINDIIGRIKINKKMKVIVDCGNAAGCIVAPKIFKKLDIDIEELYCDIDGSFPNHHPDPTVDSNLICVVEKIKAGSYDLGVAYDGDADRVVCIDSNGNIIRSDILMCIFIKDILKKVDNKKIIYDVKCSSALKDVISKYKGEPIEWKTGHSLIKSKMKLENSNFAGEMSGHIFFNDNYYGYDDAVYVSLRLIEILSNTNLTLSDLVSEIPKYFSTPELRFECVNDQEKFKIMNNLKECLRNDYSCSTIDGIKVFIDDGWGLLRASNTQPVIVCRIESKSNRGLDNIKAILSSHLSKYKGIKFEL